MSCTDDIFSCYVLVGDASGHLSVYTTKDMWSNASQTTSACGVSYQITIRLCGHSHPVSFSLSLSLSTCLSLFNSFQFKLALLAWLWQQQYCRSIRNQWREINTLHTLKRVLHYIKTCSVCGCVCVCVYSCNIVVFVFVCVILYVCMYVNKKEQIIMIKIVIIITIKFHLSVHWLFSACGMRRWSLLQLFHICGFLPVKGVCACLFWIQIQFWSYLGMFLP